MTKFTNILSDYSVTIYKVEGEGPWILELYQTIAGVPEMIRTSRADTYTEVQRLARLALLELVPSELWYSYS